MASLQFIAVFIAVAVLYVTLIDSAAVSSKVLSEDLEHLTQVGEFEKTRIQRDITTDICHHQPCGWMVYTPKTKRINFYMANTCQCPEDNNFCIRTGDDQSQGAYVYSCRPNATETDILAPQTEGSY